MNRLTKFLLWFLLGPAASIWAGFMAFVFLGVMLGGAFDIDNVSTDTQNLLRNAAIPAWIVVSIVGTVFSWCIAFISLSKK